jgi:hypothetical protein
MPPLARAYKTGVLGARRAIAFTAATRSTPAKTNMADKLEEGQEVSCVGRVADAPDGD